MKQKNQVQTAQEAGDGIDRRNFLQCMAWAGTGLVWSMVAGGFHLWLAESKPIPSPG